MKIHRLYMAKKFTNRFFWEVLPDQAWKDKPCFIVGGGPSLRDFDWALLKGKRSIGINRAFEKYDPTIIFSMDLRFLKWVVNQRYGQAALEKFVRAKSYKVWLVTYTCKLPDEIFIVTARGGYMMGHYAFTASMRSGLGHGNNSGYGALNLAVCLGANPIYLLGYDMSHHQEQFGKSSHWHDGHPMPQMEKTVTKFIHYYDRIAPELKKRKIRVVNLCTDSAMECFEKMRPEEALQ